MAIAAWKLLDICVVSNKRNMSTNVMRVDLPRAFVIMPFSEEWSKVDRLLRSLMAILNRCSSRRDSDC